MTSGRLEAMSFKADKFVSEAFMTMALSPILNASNPFRKLLRNLLLEVSTYARCNAASIRIHAVARAVSPHPGPPPEEREALPPAREYSPNGEAVPSFRESLPLLGDTTVGFCTSE